MGRAGHTAGPFYTKMMDRFTNQILAFIRQQELLHRGDRVILALSGGADSVCLTAVLWELSRLLGIRLYALHVNHGLRGEEADRDQEFCRGFAEKLEIPFRAVSVEVRKKAEAEGLSLEEAARTLRYEALFRFREELEQGLGDDIKGQGAILIATAHHGDDQAETILMNLLRGTGLRGLSGMAPKREGGIIRPLLCVSREEILKWIGKRGLSYVTDSTNLCNDYTRNLLRNRILPDLTAGVNRQAARHILQAGLICREADSYIRQEAGTFLREEGRLQEGGIALPRKLLKEKPQIFRRYVIIEALDRLGVPLKDFAERNLADLDKALFSGKGFHLDLPNGARADNLPELTVISFK